MSTSNISLSSGMSANLMALQTTSKLVSQTQERLSSGKKVNSALDNPVSFFASQSLSNRANDLTALKDGMGQAIQTIKAADTGIKGVTALINSAKGLITAARSYAGLTDSTSVAATNNLVTQFNAIRTQIDNLASDSSYQGKNLLAAGSSLSVQFNATGGASGSLNVSGFDASSSSGLGVGLAVSGTTTSQTGWTTTAALDASTTGLDAALTSLRTNSSALSSSLSIITTRQDFTTSLVTTLKDGADNLVLADMNEESANMLALQTRQSLGTTALSLSAQAAQSVLKLF